MDAFTDPTGLQILWFCLIGLMFLGYFVLEGFDFGVEMDLLALGRGSSSRRSTMLRTIGPLWDGNEVWLIAGGAAMFAAFPEWYATLFSGFYLPLLAILVALIVRVCAFKYRDKREDAAWRGAWDVLHVLCGTAPALLWGVAFSNIAAGVQLDENRWVTSTLGELLNPFALLGGLVFVLLFWLHGTLYLTLRTEGAIRADARRLAAVLAVPVLLAGGAYLLWHQLAHSGTAVTWAALLVAALALGAVLPAVRAGRERLAFAATAVAIAAATVQLFAGLFPSVLPAANDPALSLTVANASSSEHTLLVMTVVTAILLPLVIAYQAWSYWVFRHRISGDEGPMPGTAAVAGLRRRYRDAFEQE
ncbi:cytochrome d ubiquinol oxidase subunit II [Brachybacterium phenoliresistens]|uniref:Cytochrome C oxidase assembly protein n=1 Tax=Brachybacterium phenoliresistens TaxID=396014 RepID=Z9JXL6_9MICO|nr:cytochrome d ubiquinol oxidase subunit II [Brachybacterium phenoliresistens]EWS82531.1 cytochrome C oxidase assembly protein [Brachybacterium phenoliresistens]